MIATLTLNPAIDKNLQVERLVPEKKMRCPALVTEAGGGGINISKAIKELGGKTVAIFPAGGVAGMQLLQRLQEKGIKSLHLPIKEETRENFNADELSSGKQYRFVTPGPKIGNDELKSITAAIEQLEDVSFLVCSGSLPSGVPSEYLGKLANIAKSKGIKFVADTSGDPLKHLVQQGVFFIKPNMTELKSLAGKDYIEEDDVPTITQELMQTKVNAEMIIVSMGAGGAMMVTRSSSMRFRAPVVKKLSTVGAGDSMVAGVIWKLEQGSGLEEAVQFGVACGTAATVQTGTQLFRREDAEKFYKLVSKEKVA